MTSSFRSVLLRFAVFALALGLAAAALPGFARAGNLAGAQSFVQGNVERGLAILSNKSLSDEQKKTQFRDFLTNLADIRRTALFTLGAARRTASAGDIATFADAFKAYAIAVYESRLSGFSGQTLKVKGGTERAPGDYVVLTELVDPNAKADKQPLEVDFRLAGDNGAYKVVDVSVVGVWLAIEERDQFTSFLQQHNDSVPSLTAHLRELTEQLQKKPAAER